MGRGLPCIMEAGEPLPPDEVLNTSPHPPLCQHSFHLVLPLSCCLAFLQLDRLRSAGRTCETLQLAGVEDRVDPPLTWQSQLPRLICDLSHNLERSCPPLRQLPSPILQGQVGCRQPHLCTYGQLRRSSPRVSLQLHRSR